MRKKSTYAVLLAICAFAVAYIFFPRPHAIPTPTLPPHSDIVTQRASAPRPTAVKPTSPALTETPISTPQQTLCLLRGLVSVPMGSAVKIQSADTLWRDDGREEIFRRYWIQSDACPAGLFSVVTLNEQNKLVKETDCRRTNVTELSLSGGFQFQVDDAETKPNELHLGLSGGGYLLLGCPDAQVLSRGGSFHRKGEFFVDEKGCALLSRKDKSPLRMKEGDAVQKDGCLADGTCLAIAQPSPTHPEAFLYQSPGHLQVKNAAYLEEDDSTLVFPGALENMDPKERSPTGLESWNKFPALDEKLCGESH